MTIGKLAQAAGVGVETIRFYERKGVIEQPPKQGGGFRTYTQNEVTRIRFVKRAQELGFTLREVKTLLDLQSTRKVLGSEIRSKADEKIREIQLKIEDLKKMEASLKELADLCGGGEQATQECPVFECFNC